MHRLFKNSLILMVAYIVNIISVFFLTILLARYLGVADYGKYAFAKAFTALFLYIADLGLNTLLIREIAKDKTKTGKYLSNILGLKIILGIIVFSVISVLINRLGYPKETILIVYMAAAIMLMTSFSNTFRAVFMAFEKMGYEGFLMIFSQISLLGALIFCMDLKVNLLGIMGMFLLCWILCLLISIYIDAKKFVKLKFSFGFNLSKWLIKNAVPFGILGILTMICFNIDSVMLSKMIGERAVGIYNASSKLVFAVGFISQAVALSVFPFVSDKWVHNKEQAINAYKKSFKLLALLGFPIAVGITILSPHIINLFYGKQYYESIPVLRVIIWVAPFIYLTNMTGRVLSAINRQNTLIYITVVNVVVNVGLNTILIPRIGIMGAVVATVITGGISFCLQEYFITKFFCKGIDFKEILRIALAGGSMGIVIYLLQLWNWWLAVVGGIAVFFSVAYVCKLISIDDVHFLVRKSES